MVHGKKVMFNKLVFIVFGFFCLIMFLAYSIRHLVQHSHMNISTLFGFAMHLVLFTVVLNKTNDIKTKSLTIENV